MRGSAAIDRAWTLLASMRTSAVLLAAVLALLVVNVVVPQQDVSPDAYRQLVERGPLARALLEAVGLGHVSTSPVFRALLALFFVNLAVVLVDRTGATLRRIRAAPPTPAQLRAIAERGALEIAPDRGWSPAAARAVLEGLGYKIVSDAGGVLFAVRNAAALLGFPLFHASFFVLCVAGLQLYATRNVARAVVPEGQRIRGADLTVLRRAPGGETPPVDLVLQRVDVRLLDGHPIDVVATLQPGASGEPARTSRVNHPAEWGALSVLVENVGLAPVLRLVDARGVTVDRVATVVKGGGRTAVDLGAGVRATVEGVPVGPRFPERDALQGARLWTVVQDGERVVFEGPLGQRAPVPVAGGAVELEEVRYWASLKLVHERGGALLVFGFGLMVLGIVWRMVWYRREVAVTWGDGRVTLSGRGEFYPARFREELAALRDLLEEPGRLGIRRREEAP